MSRALIRGVLRATPAFRPYLRQSRPALSPSLAVAAFPTARCLSDNATPRADSAPPSSIPAQSPVDYAEPAFPDVLKEAPQSSLADAVVNAPAVEGAVNGVVDSAVDVAAVAGQTAEAAGWSDTLLQPALWLLTNVHDVTGMPWWLTIVASTFAIRCAMLPVTVMTMRNSAKMAAIQDDIKTRREAVMEAVRAGNRPLAAKKQDEMRAFMQGAGVTPVKMVIGPLSQLPVFLSFFVGVRRLSQSNPDFVNGGVAWFQDLSVMDPTFLLPVICGASLAGMIELGGDTGSTKMTPQMKMGMRGVALLSVPLTYWFPAAVFCYWLPNNLFSVSLGAVMRTDAMKKAIGMNVDPATIPGTSAARKREAQAAAGRGTMPSTGEVLRPTAVDPAAALASYARKDPVFAKPVLVSNPEDAAGKPVLLKQRPKRKRVNR